MFFKRRSMKVVLMIRTSDHTILIDLGWQNPKKSIQTNNRNKCTSLRIKRCNWNLSNLEVIFVVP